MTQTQFQKALKKKHVELTSSAGNKVKQVMRKCNVSEATVYNWIAGKSEPKNLKHKLIVCEIYGIQ